MSYKNIKECALNFIKALPEPPGYIKPKVFIIDLEALQQNKGFWSRY